MHNINYEFRQASFFKRFAAFYLALIFILLGTVLAMYVLLELQLFDLTFNTLRFWCFSFLVFLFLAFTDSFFQNLLGANLAKRLLGLKVVDRNTNQTLGFVRSLIRAICGFFSFLLLGLGFLAIAFNREALSLHDLLAGTKVIEKQRAPVLRIATNIFAGISFLIGTAATVGFVATLFLAPVSLGKTFYSLAQYSKYDLADFTENKSFRMKTHDDHLVAFVYAPKADYVEFKIDPSLDTSTISKVTAKRLGLQITNYFFVLKNFDFDLSNTSLKKVFLAKQLTLKSTESKDLDLFDFNFELGEKSAVGMDLLAVFDYSFDKQKQALSLKPYRGDALIIADENYDLESKQYLIYMLRKTRKQWRDYLRQSRPEVIQALVDLNSELRNKVNLDIDTVTGYITKATLTEPTKTEAFDKLCEDFLSKLERLRMMPESLREKSSINIEFDLVYQELI